MSRGGLPFLGPAFNEIHETQGPDLGERGDLLALDLAPLLFGKRRDGPAYIEHLRVVGPVVIEGLDRGVQGQAHHMLAALPQLQELLALRIADKPGPVVQIEQHRQPFIDGQAAAAAHQGRQEAFTEFPLRGLVMLRTQRVQDLVEVVEVFGQQARGGVHAEGPKGVAL